MRRWLAVALALATSAAWADEFALVCYNYGCAAEDLVVFTDARLDWVRNLMTAATDAEMEREYLALVIGKFYAWAGQQTPINADRGGNFADGGEPGSMDCIDHSTTTKRFLTLLSRQGLLRFHRVRDADWRQYRLIGQHFSAVILDVMAERRYAVDSWFVDNGQPAVILPIEDWLEGGGPDVN